MRPLKRRQLKAQEKPNRRRRNGVLVAAAAAFTLLAASYFLTPSTHKEEAMRQAIPQKTSQEGSTSHPTRSAPKKKTLSALKDVRGQALAALLVHLQTEGIVLELQGEFPYKSLDCSFVLLEENKEKNEPENQNLVTQLFDGTKRMLDRVNKDVDRFLGLSEEFEKYCEAQGGRFKSGIHFCVTDLTVHLADFWHEGDAVALAAAINYLDSLNLEWPGDIGAEILGQNNLYYVYRNMSISALEGENPAPEPVCVARNAYAYQSLVSAGSYLSDIIVKNPSVAGEALSNLSAYRRFQIIDECIMHLESDRKPGTRDRVFDFFDSLPPSLIEEFLSSPYGPNISFIMWYVDRHPEAIVSEK